MDERGERLRVWAAAHDLVPNDEDEANVSWLPLRTLSSVVDREIDHVFEGLWEDTRVVVFELRVGSGSEMQARSCGLAAIPFGFPPLVITNRRAPLGYESLLGLPARPEVPAELGARFEVRAEDPTIVEELLRDELLAWLLEWADRPPLLGFEVGDSWLLGFAPAGEPEQLPDLLDGVLSFRDRIPEGAFDRYPMPLDGGA